MVEIPREPVAELDNCGRGVRSPWCAHDSNTKPKHTQGSAVTDALLKRISEDLSGLDELHLVECQRVTHNGLVNALRHNRNGIKSLSMDNTSSSLVLNYLIFVHDI
jgi:hypothetical protein